MIDINNTTIADTKNKSDVAHTVEVSIPLPASSLVKPLPRTQRRRINVGDLDENRRLVKVGLSKLDRGANAQHPASPLGIGTDNYLSIVFAY